MPRLFDATLPSAKPPQHPGLVQGDVVGRAALDFILRLIRRSMVALIIDGSFMHFDDSSQAVGTLLLRCNDSAAVGDGAKSGNQSDWFAASPDSNMLHLATMAP
jgi:hypothetical protein